MHAKSGLRVFLKWKIFRPDSVIADVITLKPEGTFCEAGRQIRDRTWNQLFSGHVVDTSSSITPFRFTIIQLFLLVTCLAFSLASFSWYWHIANDTVDERTIPIANLGGTSAYLYAAIGFIALSILWVTASLALNKRWRWAIAILTLSLLLAGGLYFPYQTYIVNPIQGNQIAELHNDAASLTALAIESHIANHGSWPKDWDDLSTEIDKIGSRFALPGGSPQNANPFDPAPMTNWCCQMTPKELSQHVDVDFSVALNDLTGKTWTEFDAIRPHLPSYNMYRLEFELLINRIDTQ